MLFASPLGVAASQTISGAPWACTGGASRIHLTPTMLRISIEYGFMLYGYSPNLILGQAFRAGGAPVPGSYSRPAEEFCLAPAGGYLSSRSWPIGSQGPILRPLLRHLAQSACLLLLAF